MPIFCFSAPTTILFIRHGETAWNQEKRLQGWTDIRLNQHGIAQAQALSTHLANQENYQIAAIYSSDLIRAHETALIIAEKLNLSVKTSKNFREMCWGEAEGSYLKEFSKKPHLELVGWDYSEIPGAENFNQVLSRVTSELEAIVKQHAGETIAICSHGRTLKLLSHYATSGATMPSIPNCAVLKFTYDPAEKQPLKFHGVEH